MFSFAPLQGSLCDGYYPTDDDLVCGIKLKTSVSVPGRFGLGCFGLGLFWPDLIGYLGPRVRWIEIGWGRKFMVG